MLATELLFLLSKPPVHKLCFLYELCSGQYD